MKWVAYARKAKHETELMECIAILTAIAEVQERLFGQCCDDTLAKICK